MGDEAHHVVGDVLGEDSRSVVDEACGVGSEGGQADVHHVADLGRQGDGFRGEGRLLMVPDVVKLTLNDKDGQKSSHMTRFVFFFFKITNLSLNVEYNGVQFFLTFKFKSMADAETAGGDTMEYSISACLSTLAKTAAR